MYVILKFRIVKLGWFEEKCLPTHVAPQPTLYIEIWIFDVFCLYKVQSKQVN